MADYLSPSIAMVIPQLEQTCDELTRQVLIRSLTDYTKQLCESDPELADILLEEKKTLPRCLRYVLEQAQKSVAKCVEAMTEEEFHTLDEIQVRGQKAVMAGAAVGEEQVFAWAKAYYYGGDQVEPKAEKKALPAKSKKEKAKSTKQQAATKKIGEHTAVGKSAEQTEPTKARPMPEESGQMTLTGFAA